MEEGDEQPERLVFLLDLILHPLPLLPPCYTPPVRRRLFTIASTLSLVLCVAVCVLWGRSGHHSPRNPVQ